MQSLEPTGTRLLLLIKGIMQTGPNVLAESGGCPLFTLHACRCPPSSWKLLRNNLVIKNMGYILAAAKAICNTRFPPSVKLGSHVRRSPRPHFIDIPLWVCKKKKKELGRDNQMLRLYSAHVWELRRVFSEAWHASSAWVGSVFVLLNSFTLRAHGQQDDNTISQG